MTSSKGKPTDPKLKEKVTEEVKAKPNKDGSGKGQMAAWKAAQIGKEYEARGGDYENEAGSKNKPKKGPPEKKSEASKSEEADPEDEGDDKDEKEDDVPPKTSDAKKDEKNKKDTTKPAKKKAAAKPKAPPREGTRKSSRVQADYGKRKDYAEKDEGDEEKTKKAKK